MSAQHESAMNEARTKLYNFVAESNRIEGIDRPPTDNELDAHAVLITLQSVTVADLEMFVAEVASRPLRRTEGQDVIVGGHRPPPGGPYIENELTALLGRIHNGELEAFDAHRDYEHLHPFLDGNGRSGRALWAWHMRRDGRDPFALSFLHRWYYDSLDRWRAGG